MNKMIALLAVIMVTVPAMAQDFAATPEVSPNQKGSLLYWSNVEVKYDSNENLVMDTILELTNDSNTETYVQLYFVNGDDPICDEIRSGTPPFILLERSHPGWNFVDVQIYLSPNKPTYWSAATGNNFGADSIQVPPFGNLDRDPSAVGSPNYVGNGRPDPDSELLRTVRGFVVGWAVDVTGTEITHNHLTGAAMQILYTAPAAWEYDAFAYERDAAAGAGDGALNMDGDEYSQSPARLQLDFYSVPSLIISGVPGPAALVFDTDLTLHPVSADFLPGGEPAVTFVQADIWNQNEDRFSGAGRCIACWDQTLLRSFQGPGIIAGNHFLRDNIGTDKGKARLTGRTDPACWVNLCPHNGDTTTIMSGAYPILGVAVKLLAFGNGGALAGSPLTLQGTDDSGVITWDIVEPGTELRDAELDVINARKGLSLRPQAPSKAVRTIRGK
jgi:hypothetical protein